MQAVQIEVLSIEEGATWRPHLLQKGALVCKEEEYNLSFLFISCYLIIWQLWFIGNN